VSRPKVHDVYDLPDAGAGACCMGSAMQGAKGCTCWRAEHDVVQQPLRRELVARGLRPRGAMCPDCAFRPGSPERRGDARFAHSGEGELEDLAAHHRFTCHMGTRRRLALVHPSGTRVEGGPGDYDPPIEGGIPFKADGTPADLCAGWIAARKALDAERAALTVEPGAAEVGGGQ
jgi:hypothetical protein